ncbi:hypothetical protein OCU04_000107 [Sclerotinia nivalis]|uniref:Heterokaryon incompatibility domain-containing protein n=1 Tax=Sclerotinia nivalis TaxID=352851 RepID=A0A9X0DNE3_9HELO|nr:hypothetical protein OCU04_000107 [Sclerotinia nivalis]
MDSAAMFKYDPLEDVTRDIRLIRLLPGKAHDHLWIDIFHQELVAAEQDRTNCPSRDDVQQTLPTHWEVSQTVEGRLLFTRETDSVTITTWKHPIKDLDTFRFNTPVIGALSPPSSSFEALSYVWGPQNDQVEIQVVPRFSTHGLVLNPGGSLFVGQALANALQHLRRENEERTLWIDALCIDQPNKVEKQGQIRRMDEIYRLAPRVIIWLGPGTANSEMALSTLEYLGTQVEVTLDGRKFASPSAEQKFWFSEKVDLPYTAATWKAIHDLLNRTYFRRLWIIQEVSLANGHAIMQCGDKSAPLVLFRKAVACLYSKSNLPYEGLRPLVLECVRITESHRGKTLMALLENSRQQQCQDPKDKIYGILGIAPKRFAKLIRPDYSDGVSVTDTYRDMFLDHMRHFGRWELFACEQSDRKIQGPSWVPDWTSLDVPGWGSRQQYSAGHSIICFTYQKANRLEVTGIRVATVTRVGDPVVSGDPTTDLMTVRGWEPDNLYGRDYVTGDNLSDAYAITLLQHRIRDRWPANTYMPTLKEWKSQATVPAEFGEGARSENKVGGFDRTNSLSNRGYNCVLRRALFFTAEGYLGLGPMATQPGDIVSVFLGCDPPMVLRPRADGAFELVGYCFVYGLNDATSLLGPLPSPWQVQLRRHQNSMFREVYRFFNPATGEVTASDPRLESDPVWERVEIESLGRDLGPDDPTICDFFRNKKTGIIINYDPRLLPEALEERLQCQGKTLEIFPLE